MDTQEDKPSPRFVCEAALKAWVELGVDNAK